ncbi:16S rRNA (guanine(966)-N(2))-methyltransferase RsmD [Verticiella sediminum]|uniref:16S rRNA (Guanine(966)-N(2))-methyltransferase RsmD n=1 Tax=Verticiella sediminum TaxID=1247510 RepID=A0A556B086_9BURK|nr:16S rRNA (guanine(966)-N(2))-methyltransferase RsmD [Verticiella sediminum]TSH98592.1 16S rRNA (guanine(966)-N(2))-methyltransferase RsmD [Verticiella sediminum]
MPARKPPPRQVRIIGGQYRRTPLPVLDAPGLRPTPDRVRETLYNWLSHLWDGEFTGRRVLDLFAGTGALGFEAASRGAAAVTLVEAGGQLAAALRATRDKLHAHQVDVVVGDAMGFLARHSGAAFDLVLLDPPFGEDWLGRLWPAVERVVAPGGLLYVESEAAIAPPPGHVLLREGRAGAVHYRLLQRTADSATL